MIWVWRSIWIAAVYFALGYPALSLADPPGYASPVWPAAGFAVGVVFCYRFGYKACIGVFLGSTVLNWTLHPLVGLYELALPTLIGAGAASQASLARFLLVRLIGDRSALSTLREEILFLTVAGPVACSLNALWGPTVLRLIGPLGGDLWASHVATWWLGDTVGAILFAPATLAVLSRDESGWRDRWGAIVWIGAAGLTLTLLLYLANRLDRTLTYQVAVSWFFILASVQAAALRVTVRIGEALRRG